MTIVLYEMDLSPPCRAVLMACRHLGIDVNRKRIDLLAKEQLKPAFIKINPEHVVPTIDDDGFILWESAAILAYICNKYAPDSSLYPKDPQERATVDRLLHFNTGTLHNAGVAVVRPLVFTGQPADQEKYDAYQKALKSLNEFLAKTPYVAGNHITIADFSIFASLTMAELINIPFDDHPNVSAWFAKLKSEISSYKEINEEPLEKFKEYLKSKNIL